MVGFASNDVDCLMHSDPRVLLAVLHLITGQNPVVADLLKFEFAFARHLSSLLEILNFRELILVLLGVLSEISAQSCLAHSWQSNRHQEKLSNVPHFWVFE